MEPDNRNAQDLQQRYAVPEIDDKTIAWDKDEAPTEWVPSQFEKQVKAIPEDRWNLYQTLGGAAVGLIVAALLFFTGTGANYGLIAGALLALLLPNWLEKKGRRKLLRARVVMIAVLAAAILVMTVYMGMTRGWDFFSKPQTASLLGMF